MGKEKDRRNKERWKEVLECGKITTRKEQGERRRSICIYRRRREKEYNRY